MRTRECPHVQGHVVPCQVREVGVRLRERCTATTDFNT